MNDEPQDSPRQVVWERIEFYRPPDERRHWLLAGPRQTHRTYRTHRRGPYRGRVQALIEAAGRRKR